MATIAVKRLLSAYLIQAYKLGSEFERLQVLKQNTLPEVIDSERELILAAPKRYGALFDNAIHAYGLLGRSIKSIDADRFIFAGFLSLTRKHHLLATLSAVRLHHVQAMMNLRQVLEAGAAAAYAIAHTDSADFAETLADGTLDASQKLNTKRYKWLEKHYPLGSNMIKNLKDQINLSAAHASVINTTLTLNLETTGERFPTTFFDIEDDFVVRSDLWFTTAVALGVMDLLHEVNRTVGSVKFADDFVPTFGALLQANERLRSEAMESDAYKRSQALRKE